MIPGRYLGGRIPRWARWPLAYLILVSLSALVGLVAFDFGSVAFALGIACVFVSLFFIRMGGPRRVVTQRAQDGTPLVREWMPEAEREREIRAGVAIFLLGIALWMTAIASYALL